MSTVDVTPEAPLLPLVGERADRVEELTRAFYALLGAERRLKGRDQQRPGELSHAQVRSLLELAKGGGTMSAGALARAVELNPASMTATLDHLEELGVVRRGRSDEDRRVVLVRLTDDGRAVVAERRARWQRLWGAALAGVPDEDLAVASRTLRTVAGLLDEL
ncbi:MarR family winged helix-turn-helix transcriptional regulator [Patulibacter defluvii]|uniref:MarR family winged helix-turn-helix transcriptional regulator n=1 Tax=Patulibacter defluvii TaxID=3095358 RepID=UPI002A75E568|nr:MarR family transcriptional regulator [Patulibacter sp. DM4]